MRGLHGQCQPMLNKMGIKRRAIVPASTAMTAADDKEIPTLGKIMMTFSYLERKSTQLVHIAQRSTKEL